MANASEDTLELRQFWNAFAGAAGILGTKFTVFRFGDSRELANELAQSVIAGTKRATASLRRDFAVLACPPPKPGDFGIVIDGNNTPQCVVRLTQVELKRLHEVDAPFAFDEGGGDGTLEWWVSAHERFFRRRGAHDDFKVGDDPEVVLERFEVVWPPELADRRPMRT